MSGLHLGACMVDALLGLSLAVGASYFLRRR
jgi:hypothetical protein